MLPRNQLQEALSRTYVRAVAARAGVTCGDIGQDFGIDMYLSGIELRDQQYLDVGPQIDVQVKSGSRIEMRGTDLIYDLDVRAYNLLRDDVPRRPPCILVLVVLPEEERDWMSQTSESLVLRRCGYWMSLRGAGPTSAYTTIRITIPGQNLFTVAALETMLGRVKQGGMP